MAPNAYPDFGQAHLGLAAVLASGRKPELALPHVEPAVSLDPGNDVSVVPALQVPRHAGQFGRATEALAEFERLHSPKISQTLFKLKLFQR